MNEPNAKATEVARDAWREQAEHLEAVLTEAEWIVSHAVASWSGHAIEWWARQSAFLASRRALLSQVQGVAEDVKETE